MNCSFRQRIHVLVNRMEQADDWFHRLTGITETLHRNVKAIRFVRVAGVKESVHLIPKHQFRTLFDGVKTHIIETIEHCSELRSQVKQASKAVAVVNESKDLLRSDTSIIEETSRQLQLQAAGKG